MSAEPSGGAEFDKFASDYDNTLAQQLAFFDNENEYFARYKVELALKLFGGAPQRVVDFGCGVGRSIGMFRARLPEAELFGCDVSEKSIEVAAARRPDATFSAPQACTARDADLVFAACVFHHIPPAERERSLAWCRDRLRPGGMLMLVEHNPFNPVTRHMVDTCPFDEDAVLMRKRETEGLVARAGFDTPQSGYTLFFPGALQALRPVERFMEWLPLGGQYYVAARKAMA